MWGTLVWGHTCVGAHVGVRSQLCGVGLLLGPSSQVAVLEWQVIYLLCYFVNPGFKNNIFSNTLINKSCIFQIKISLEIQ